MTRELNGRELADYIKERQARSVRSLRQADKVVPKLAIVRTNPNPVVDSYMRIKESYGADIGVEVVVHTMAQQEAPARIAALNADATVHGIIVQIPLPDPSETIQVLNAVALHKDVDGLAENTDFDPATPMAINWLLAGYGIDLPGKDLVIVGNGRLVGGPLSALWSKSGLAPKVVDKYTQDAEVYIRNADVIVTATGVPGRIVSNMVKQGAIIVDAGVATDSNGLVGDVAPDVRARTDLKAITPEKGGVGPLTVCALFENVITAARRTVAAA